MRTGAPPGPVAGAPGARRGRPPAVDDGDVVAGGDVVLEDHLDRRVDAGERGQPDAVAQHEAGARERPRACPARARAPRRRPRCAAAPRTSVGGHDPGPGPERGELARIGAGPGGQPAPQLALQRLGQAARRGPATPSGAGSLTSRWARGRCRTPPGPCRAGRTPPAPPSSAWRTAAPGHPGLGAEALLVRAEPVEDPGPARAGQVVELLGQRLLVPQEAERAHRRPARGRPAPWCGAACRGSSGRRARAGARRASRRPCAGGRSCPSSAARSRRGHRAGPSGR